MQNSIKVLVAALALGVSGGVFSAVVDGGLSTTESSGDVTVTASVTEAVRLTVLENTVHFGDVALDGTVSGADADFNVGICVYHRGVTTAGLTLSSSNTTNKNADPDRFNMGHTTPSGDANAVEVIEYSVTIGGDAFVTGVEQEVAANATASQCSGGSNHTVSLALVDNLDEASAGSYSDTLTIVVQPEL